MTLMQKRDSDRSVFSTDEVGKVFLRVNAPSTDETRKPGSAEEVMAC